VNVNCIQLAQDESQRRAIVKNGNKNSGFKVKLIDQLGDYNIFKQLKKHVPIISTASTFALLLSLDGTFAKISHADTQYSNAL
jgi:hypothetical protein